MDTTVEQERKEYIDDNLSGVEADKNVPNLRPSGGKISREQKGKLKKIKEKYGEQDEDERKIRMALLASAGKVAKDESELQSGEAVGKKGMKLVNGPDDTLKRCYKCKKPGHLSRGCPENSDVTDYKEKVVLKCQNGDGSEITLDAVDKTASEMDRVSMEEDDIHEIGEEEKGKLNDVDFLTGSPLPNGILLYAVPVCGPYNALQMYKYHTKITPGTAKKGKAVKTAINLFSHMPDATNREKELMKACTDPELVSAIIGNVKITAAGLVQLKQKQKKGKKTSKEGS